MTPHKASNWCSEKSPGSFPPSPPARPASGGRGQQRSHGPSSLPPWPRRGAARSASPSRSSSLPELALEVVSRGHPKNPKKKREMPSLSCWLPTSRGEATLPSFWLPTSNFQPSNLPTKISQRKPKNTPYTEPQPVRPISQEGGCLFWELVLPVAGLASFRETKGKTKTLLFFWGGRGGQPQNKNKNRAQESIGLPPPASRCQLPAQLSGTTTRAGPLTTPAPWASHRSHPQIPRFTEKR